MAAKIVHKLRELPIGSNCIGKGILPPDETEQRIAKELMEGYLRSVENASIEKRPQMVEVTVNVSVQAWFIERGPTHDNKYRDLQLVGLMASRKLVLAKINAIQKAVGKSHVFSTVGDLIEALENHDEKVISRLNIQDILAIEWNLRQAGYPVKILRR